MKTASTDPTTRLLAELKRDPSSPVAEQADDALRHAAHLARPGRRVARLSTCWSELSSLAQIASLWLTMPSTMMATVATTTDSGR